MTAAPGNTGIMKKGGASAGSASLFSTFALVHVIPSSSTGDQNAPLHQLVKFDAQPLEDPASPPAFWPSPETAPRLQELPG